MIPYFAGSTMRQDFQYFAGFEVGEKLFGDIEDFGGVDNRAFGGKDDRDGDCHQRILGFVAVAVGRGDIAARESPTS